MNEKPQLNLCHASLVTPNWIQPSGVTEEDFPDQFKGAPSSVSKAVHPGGAPSARPADLPQKGIQS